MNDLCTRPIFGRVQRSFFWGDVIAIVRYVYALCMLVPRTCAPPSEKGGVWRPIFMNHSMRICMITNTPVRYVALKYLWLCILLAYRLRGMQLMNHEYILAVLIAVQMKSRNPLWNPEIHLKSRNPLWNPEIRFEIQKSTLKSRTPLWNSEIYFEIQKST